MYLLVPAKFEQANKEFLWFKDPRARELAHEKGVKFGFEIKGDPEVITKSLPVYWGYHFSKDVSSTWYYHPEQRDNILRRFEKVASFKPAYINFHGAHLAWHLPPKDRIERYANHSQPKEYLKILEANIEMFAKFKKIFPNITLENTPLASFYEDSFYTYLCSGVGRLDDLIYLEEKAGLEILLDAEHLILTLNFLNREKNYKNLPVDENAAENLEISKIFGYVIAKDVIPYVKESVDYSAMVKKIGAKRYHVTGSTQDAIFGIRDVSHGPIEVDDKTFRKNLRPILDQKPESILIETANSIWYPKIYGYLRPNETELSFYHLCEILLEELD